MVYKKSLNSNKQQEKDVTETVQVLNQGELEDMEEEKGHRRKMSVLGQKRWRDEKPVCLD